MPRNKVRRQLSRQYRKREGKTISLHHIIPKSRHGEDSEFNLYPWHRRMHEAWHFLFCNLTIYEVFALLEDVHRAVFNTDPQTTIAPWWIKGCKLERGLKAERELFQEDLNHRLARQVLVERFRHEWMLCFGGPSVAAAHRVLANMALFMMFGKEAIRIKNFTIDANQHRLWAFANFSMLIRRH